MGSPVPALPPGWLENITKAEQERGEKQEAEEESNKQTREKRMIEYDTDKMYKVWLSRHFEGEEVAIRYELFTTLDKAHSYCRKCKDVVVLAITPSTETRFYEGQGLEGVDD